MIRCRVIKDFNLNDFHKLVDLKRSGARDEYGKLYLRDTFKCENEMAKYLNGGNEKKEIVVKIIELKPDESKK